MGHISIGEKGECLHGFKQPRQGMHSFGILTPWNIRTHGTTRTRINDTPETRPPPCLFNNHPEILRFSSGFLLSAPKLPFRNLFRPGSLFFIVLHGEKEIPGPLKKPRDKDINTTTPNNINHQFFRPILYRTPSNNLSRKPDGPPCFHCEETPRPSRQNTHTRPHDQQTR
jgi:hypothetical protein